MAHQRSMLVPSDGPVVLITGCSSGLGEALALCLHAEQKLRVVATARRLTAIEHLSELGICCVQLDVTDEASVAECVGTLMDGMGRIDCLINSAGISKIGPIVEQDVTEMRAVLETNVIGAMRMAQAVTPRMAANNQGGGDALKGLIINVGSVTTMMTTPWTGIYSASKAALMALSDAMRLELAPFGIHVSFVIAGAIQSSIGENAVGSSHLAKYSDPKSMYSSWYDSIMERAHMSQVGAMPAKDAAGQIARVVKQALLRNSKKPPTSFFAGAKARLFWWLGRMQKTASGWPTNAIMARRFDLNRRAPNSLMV